MKRIVKFAVLTICLSLFFGNVVCLAQNESVAPNPPAAPSATVAGPMSDFDAIQPNPGPLGSRAEHWRERAGGTYLEYFDVNAGKILGWMIMPGSSKGVDKWGNVDSAFTAHWATMGYSRWAYSGEVAYTSPYPFSSYTYVNAWGASGSGTMNTPATYYSGSLYESFFDGVMTGPGGVGWTDDGNSTWSMMFDSDPGNYIDNRVYSYAGNGVGTGWKGTTYDWGYSSSYGFSYNVDIRRTDDEGNWAYGMFFFANTPAGPTGNCYVVKLADATSGNNFFSVYKYTSGSATALISWFQDPAVNPSKEWNNVRVETLNGNMEFFCNGTSMGTIYDTSYTSGDIGVGVYDPDGYATCEWDNVTVHRQPSVKLGIGSGQPTAEMIPADPNNPNL